MLILSYSDDCGNDHNLASGTQYHQKNGFINSEMTVVWYIFKFFLSTGLDKRVFNENKIITMRQSYLSGLNPVIIEFESRLIMFFSISLSNLP